MKYPIVIHKEKKSDYGVTIPDLAGCFSAGTTLEEAINNAQEAIICHIEGLIADAENIPKVLPIESHKTNPSYKDAIWAIVDVDLDKISGKAKRVNITIPERILSRIDEYVEEKGDTRSAFLTQAALEYIYDHSLVQ